jgi:hypothetical protein
VLPRAELLLELLLARPKPRSRRRRHGGAQPHRAPAAVLGRPATRLAIEKYMQSVRKDAPWCPSNIEFIRRINGLDSIDDVKRIVFDASYLVMGLGDVYLGAPVATPLDPRHRLVTTKYNPARTWTPENAVGIGGAYLCVYGMEGPGGYQFVGRTLQMWNRWRQTAGVRGKPWLLRFFDQIRFYPVSEDELLRIREAFPHGRYRCASKKPRSACATTAASWPTTRVDRRLQGAAAGRLRRRARALGPADHRRLPGICVHAERHAHRCAALIDAGAIPLGKTNLDQFATGLNGTRSPYGACRNAFDPDYISGGSSSGSAVAWRSVWRVSLGTDTAGSGRVPAAFNNLVGHKPSCGTLSTRGVVPACRSLDAVSIFALTAEDAERVLAVAAGFDAEDEYSRPLARTASTSAAPRVSVSACRWPRTCSSSATPRLSGCSVRRWNG